MQFSVTNFIFLSDNVSLVVIPIIPTMYLMYTVVFHAVENITLKKVAYFSVICYHTLFQDLKVRGCSSFRIISCLHHVSIDYNVLERTAFGCFYIGIVFFTKFRENPSVVQHLKCDTGTGSTHARVMSRTLF